MLPCRLGCFHIMQPSHSLRLNSSCTGECSTPRAQTTSPCRLSSRCAWNWWHVWRSAGPSSPSPGVCLLWLFSWLHENEPIIGLQIFFQIVSLNFVQRSTSGLEQKSKFHTKFKCFDFWTVKRYFLNNFFHWLKLRTWQTQNRWIFFAISQLVRDL